MNRRLYLQLHVSKHRFGKYSIQSSDVKTSRHSFISWYYHDDVIKRKHFPLYWPFVPRIHRLPVNSPRKGQWRGALMFSLICAWINRWVHNREPGDLRRHRAHYDVVVMHYFEDIIRIASGTNDPMLPLQHAIARSYDFLNRCGCLPSDQI